MATLAELALVLAVISVAVNLVARIIVNRTGRLGGPVGSGLSHVARPLCPGTRLRRIGSLGFRLFTYLALAPASWPRRPGS